MQSRTSEHPFELDADLGLLTGGRVECFYLDVGAAEVEQQLDGALRGRRADGVADVHGHLADLFAPLLVDVPRIGLTGPEQLDFDLRLLRSEERRVGKECRS